MAGLEPADVHEFVVVVVVKIAAVAVEHPGVIGHEDLFAPAKLRERFAPQHRADLPLRRDRARRQAALNRVDQSVRCELFKTERRLPLAHFQIHFRNAVPVDENVGAGKLDAIGICHRRRRTRDRG